MAAASRRHRTDITGETMKTPTMRAPTHVYLARLPARKRTTLIVLFIVMFGGVVAGGALG
jgi:hypothetical protein